MPNKILYTFLATAMAFAVPSAEASLSFVGGTPVKVDTEASTGLSAVYVFETTAGIKATASSTARWQRFSNLGAAYAEDLQPTVAGGVSSIALDVADMGYVLDEDGRQTYFWVVNYDRHKLDLQTLDIAEETDCNRAVLRATGSGDKITYYSINGRGIELSRELSLAYTTLQCDESQMAWNPVERTATFGSISGLLSVNAPLCNTTFTLTGDRFTREWGYEESVESPMLEARAVDAYTVAEQTKRDVPNEQSDGSDGLGGSAPCEITFTAAVTDAAIFRQWQISRSSEFVDVDNSFTDLEFTYTFTENGTSYVRFVAADASGECEYVGPTYDVFIGESKLECPNAFSPGSTPGVNDVWCVSYKSIVEYECHIFNKWGKEIMSTTDPAQGWDGRSGGKLVPAGVYYYVIKARGADGRRYDLSGNINIVNYTGANGGATAE